MKWFLIDKSITPQPDGDEYDDPRWKEALAKEGRYQCVYCTVHENHMGGPRAFHVEHYKPKSKFLDLTHEMSNLFYVCPVCNTFKHNDWPCDPCPLHTRAAYPDPSKVDYSDIFKVKNDHVVEGRNPAGKYMVLRLYLNRPQLVVLRRWVALRRRLEHLEQEARVLRDRLKDSRPANAFDLVTRLYEQQDLVQDLHRRVEDARTYRTSDVTKPTGRK